MGLLGNPSKQFKGSINADKSGYGIDPHISFSWQMPIRIGFLKKIKAKYFHIFKNRNDKPKALFWPKLYNYSSYYCFFFLHPNPDLFWIHNPDQNTNTLFFKFLKVRSVDIDIP
jgi:hypothetical protein